MLKQAFVRVWGRMRYVHNLSGDRSLTHHGWGLSGIDFPTFLSSESISRELQEVSLLFIGPPV